MTDTSTPIPAAQLREWREAKLCYVSGDWAYFTTNPNQWGDDWNDAPYEHNGGLPYIDAGFSVFKLAFDGCFDRPCDTHFNSPYSVEQINAGAVAWLIYKYSDNKVVINAGVTIPRFIELIESAKGEVYLPGQFALDAYDSAQREKELSDAAYAAGRASAAAELAQLRARLERAARQLAAVLGIPEREVTGTIDTNEGWNAALAEVKRVVEETK